MTTLDWISDDDFEQALKTLLKSINDANEKVKLRMNRNVIDPFHSLLIASTFNVRSRENLIAIQQSQSTLSAISNALGRFHQDILGSVAGWVNHDAGYDLENLTQKILAEVKNKHNTMNSSNRQKVLGDLDIAIQQKGRGWKGYLVIIIPKNPERYTKEITTVQRPVYEIDGASFYEQVTNQPQALRHLFYVLNSRLNTKPDITEYCKEILNNSIPH